MKRTPEQIIGRDAVTQLVFEGYVIMPVPSGPVDEGSLADELDLVDAIEAEREACAVVADNYSMVDGPARVIGLNIGHMIRTRTE